VIALLEKVNFSESCERELSELNKMPPDSNSKRKRERKDQRKISREDNYAKAIDFRRFSK